MLGKNQERHEHPTKLIKMKSGYAHLGDVQFLPGYCVLFADPEVKSLNDLNMQQRADFLLDMSLLGDAIMTVCKPIRINYGILGNSTPFLHAHLFPRYEWESKERQKKNVWSYPETYWSSGEYAFEEIKHGQIKKHLTEALKNLIKETPKN